MNEFDKNKSIENLLEETAEQTQPNLMFKAELEEKLRKAYKPRKSFFSMLGLGQTLRDGSLTTSISSTLTVVAVLGALVFFMLWMFQSVRPETVSGTGDNFICPVTLPNGSNPPGATVIDPYSHGNGELWTTLWPNGKVVMQDDNIEPDGAYAMKWLIFRGVTGSLSIEGQRLDADAEPLRAFLSDGYGDNGLQIIALIFPTTGCWEVTARVGESSLTFVTEVVYGEPTPMPNENPEMLSTLVPNNSGEQGEGYVFRGGNLFLSQPLPEAPANANVFTIKDYPPATVEQVRALADKIGIQGDVYTADGRISGTTEFVISDGKQYLSMGTEGYFFYTADLEKNNRISQG